MKKNNFVFILLGLFISSCSFTTGGVEPPKEFTNKLLLNGVLGEIKFAEMTTYTKLPADKNYNIDITLFTGTTEAVYQPGPSYSGIGSYFSFSLWSNEATIASGVYTIDGLVNNSFSITKAWAELNVDWSTRESDFASYLNGTIEITNLGGGIYKIEMNCTDYDGNPVTGFYKGEFVKL